MEKKNFRILIYAIVALLVIVAIYFVFADKEKVNVATDSSLTVAPESTQDLSSKTPSAKVVPISYAQALVKYADRRIQLDPMCQAHPNTITYKDNTGIMIDNRSPQTRTVKVGTTFTIKPWGFKIVVLPDVYLKSKTLLVDCDGSQNVATILVQE